MNSLQQQSTPEAKTTPEDYVLAFQGRLDLESNVNEVEKLLLKLQFLGLNYDPFTPEASSECNQVIEVLGLRQHLTNPYLATNLLLRLLDKTEERLNKLKQ
jgi:hypothetical protein